MLHISLETVVECSTGHIYSLINNVSYYEYRPLGVRNKNLFLQSNNNSRCHCHRHNQRNNVFKKESTVTNPIK